jgi:hypothetical protein
VERARYEMATQQSTSISVNDTFGGGQYAVSTSQVTSPCGAVAATVTAQYGERAVTETRLIGAGFHIPRPFDYAFASAQYDWDSNYNTMGSAGLYGDTRINGYLQWTSGGRINGNLITQSTIYYPQPTVTGSKIQGAPALDFPTVDWDYLRSIADSYYPSGASAHNISFSADNWIIYIDGNLEVGNGRIYGRGMVVVDGELKFRWGPLTYGTYGPCVFIARKVKVDSPVSTVHGFIYCPEGEFRNDGGLSVYGNVACLLLNTQQGINITLDPALRDDPDLGWEMHVPGY